LKEAMADYTKLIALDPKDPEGYRHRAVAHTLAGDSKSAEADLRAILKIKPDDADAQSRLKALETRAANTPPATGGTPITNAPAPGTSPAKSPPMAPPRASPR
jgi:tetratricopeptide (TPR) repeat protein